MSENEHQDLVDVYKATVAPWGSSFCVAAEKARVQAAYDLNDAIKLREKTKAAKANLELELGLEAQRRQTREARAKLPPATMDPRLVRAVFLLAIICVLLAVTATCMGYALVLQ